MELSNKILSDITVYMKYAKFFFQLGNGGIWGRDRFRGATPPGDPKTLSILAYIRKNANPSIELLTKIHNYRTHLGRGSGGPRPCGCPMAHGETDLWASHGSSELPELPQGAVTEGQKYRTRAPQDAL